MKIRLSINVRFWRMLALALVGLPMGAMAGGNLPSDNPLELIGSKMNFRGVVVKKSCELALVSQDQTIQFREVDIKNLYKVGYGPKVPFEIQLLNCDTTILDEVNVMFSGSADVELPGRLAVSGANDVAIALFSDKKPNEVLPLNKATDAQKLNSGDNLLKFQARVEGHPSAIGKQNIKTGTFNGIAQFTLEYK